MVWASFIFTAVMCLHGYAFVLTKKLINMNAAQINYNLGIMLFMTCALFMPYALADPNFRIPSSLELLEALFLSGLPMTLAQLCVLYSLLLTRNYGMLTPFQFSTIIVGYLVSVLRYDEEVNILCATGAIAIIVGVIFIVKCKDRSLK
jgi:drug/metabolite transporter (DMT)-like permease